jgi:hypothetical protein
VIFDPAAMRETSSALMDVQTRMVAQSQGLLSNPGAVARIKANAAKRSTRRTR